MNQNLKRFAVGVTLLVVLTGCSNEVPSGPRNLLPGLEARTRYGFSVEEATKALESFRTVVDDALTAGIAFKDLDFDNLNELSPEIAILPGDMNITQLGGAATVVAVENRGAHLMGAAYGDSGFCLYMKITDAKPLKIERGVGFAIDCNAKKASDSITWSSNDTFPGTDKVELPQGTVTTGQPQGGANNATPNGTTNGAQTSPGAEPSTPQGSGNQSR